MRSIHGFALVLSIFLVTLSVGCISPAPNGIINETLIGEFGSEADCLLQCYEQGYLNTRWNSETHECYCTDDEIVPSEASGQGSPSGGITNEGLLEGVDYEEIVKNLRKETANDFDNDTLENDYEDLIGTNKRRADTDFDGLNDNVELDIGTSPITYDTDGDGLNDGEEVGYQTDPLSRDTDSDGLSDMEEVGAVIDALDDDSDNDGVKDGKEVDWGSDTDFDNKINAKDPDSDGDGLNDGEEFGYGTSMVANDTDSDGISDYDEAVLYQTDPVEPDTDGDGLLDGQEGYDSIWTGVSGWLYMEDMNKQTEYYPLGPGTYQVMVKAKVVDVPLLSTSSANPKMVITVNGAGLDAETFDMPNVKDGGTPVNELRWYITSLFTVQTSASVNVLVSIETSNAADAIRVEDVAIVKVGNNNRTYTNPLSNDTDSDGIIDYKEASLDAYWFEAENYMVGDTIVLDNSNLSNSKAADNFPTNTGPIVSIDAGTVQPGTYAVFIRGYGDFWPRLEVRLSYGGITTIGTSELDGQFRRGKWVHVYYGEDENRTFVVNSAGNIKIDILAEGLFAMSEFFIDKVLLIKMTYFKPAGVFTMSGGPTPRKLTDPFDPDTDGDQFRPVMGTNNMDDTQVCQSVKQVSGYLTDKLELDNALNPFNLDSDSDFQEDNYDTNPWGMDADDDAIPDSTEDTYPSGGNMAFDQEYELTDWCNPDTDGDRLLDGEEDWDFDKVLDPEETDPSNPDTDGDGLLDGLPSSNAQLPAADYSYTISKYSARFQFLNSTLNRLNLNGTSYSPWKDNGDGTVTFIGEVSSSPVDIDTDDDRLPDGVEVILLETDPADADSDNDNRTDYDEVFVYGSDPNVPDLPDLKVISVWFDGDELLSELETPNGLKYTQSEMVVEVENIGSVTSEPGVRLAVTSGGKTVEGVLYKVNPGEGGVRRVYFDVIFASDNNYDYIDYINSNKLVFKPGTHTITLDIDSRTPPSGWNSLWESDYSNNVLSKALAVKGDIDPDGGIYCYDFMLNMGQETTFNIWGKDMDGVVSKYEIDFDGDGIFDYETQNQGLINHTYTISSYTGNDEARFNATLRITDDDDNSVIRYVSRGITVFPSGATDSDGDGLTNDEEIALGTNLYDADFDQDGLNDYEEIRIYSTDPFDYDTDKDGIGDGFELIVAEHFHLKGFWDMDGDGVPNILDPDSDNDGMMDGTEFKFVNPEPQNPAGQYMMSMENWHGTNPYNKDTDGDGINDTAESWIYIRGVMSRPHLNLDPERADTDGDGLNDYDEVFVYGTASDNPDTDGDGLEDGIDMQPLSVVDELKYFGFNSAEHVGDTGIQWANRYPKYMLRYEVDMTLWGLDGNSWDINENPDENLHNEGVLNSNLDVDYVMNELGLGDPDETTPSRMRAYRMVEYAGVSEDKTVVEMYDDWGKYKIKYDFERKKTKAYMRNDESGPDSKDTWYTGWEVTLDPHNDNSIVLQFSIDESRDLFSDDFDNEFFIPSFIYRLYQKGETGMNMYRVSQNTNPYLRNYDKDYVMMGVAMGTEIKPHHYQAEIRIPDSQVNSSSMFIVITPVWFEFGDNYFALDPHYIQINSMTKIIHYNNVTVLKIGCDNFGELSDPIELPEVWQGRSKVNFTLVQKMENNKYFSSNIVKTRDVVANGNTMYEPLVIYERTTYSDARLTNLSDLSGLLGVPEAQSIRDRFDQGTAGTIAAYNDREIVIEFPEGMAEWKRELKWAAVNTVTTAVNFIPVAGPFIAAGINIALTIGEVINNAVNAAHASNKIEERYYKEQIATSIIGLPISLIPYSCFFELKLKMVSYELEFLQYIGLENDVSAELINELTSTPLTAGITGQFMDFDLSLLRDIPDWIRKVLQYAFTDYIPSEFSMDAVLAANERAINDVDFYNTMYWYDENGEKQCYVGTCSHVYIPPE